MSDETEPWRRLSRRKALALAGVSLTAGLAGCGDDDDTETETETETDTDTQTPTPTSTPTPGPTLRRDTLTTIISRAPPNLDISNGSEQYPVSFSKILWTPSVVEVVGDQFQTKPWALLEDWEIVEGEIGSEENPPVIEETIKPGFHWWEGEKGQGEEITAEDIIEDAKYQTYWELDYQQLQEMGELSTSLPEPVDGDDYTYRYEWQERASILDVRDNIGFVPRVPATKFPWSSWIDRYEDLLEDEDEQGIQDLEREIGFTGISPTQFMNWGLGHGPYELTEVNAADLYMELRDPEKHPGAERPNVSTLHFRNPPEGSSNVLKQQGEIDWQPGPLSSDLEGTVPDWYQTLDSWQTGTRKWLVLNFNNVHCGRPNFRRAIASVLDVAQIQEQGWGEEPYGHQVGLGGVTIQEFMGQDFLDKSYTYGAEGGIKPDMEQAEAFMGQAGYERNSNDVWVGPDGNEAELSISIPTRNAWVLSGQALVSQLSDFGITAELNFADDWETTLSDQSYDVVPFNSVGSIDNLNPTLSPDQPEALALGENVGVGDTGTHGLGRRSIIEVPTDIGNLDSPGSFGSTDTEEIDLISLWDEDLSSAPDVERVREIFRTLGTYWNYHVPNIVLSTSTSGFAGNTRDFSWPEAGDESYRSGHIAYYMVKFGFVQGIPEE